MLSLLGWMVPIVFRVQACRPNRYGNSTDVYA